MESKISKQDEKEFNIIYAICSENDISCYYGTPSYKTKRLSMIPFRFHVKTGKGTARIGMAISKDMINDTDLINSYLVQHITDCANRISERIKTGKGN